MRAVGSTAAGGVVGVVPPSLPTGRTDVDLDALRARREAEAARRAATNPFAKADGQPRPKSTARLHGAALVNPAYEAAAFTTPPPAPASTVEVPVPTPKPAPRPPRPATSPGQAIDAAGVVRDYVEDGMTSAAIARARGLSVSEVHRILERTPGVNLHTDAPARPPAVVESSRAERAARAREIRNRQILDLYTGPEQLTQPQIADRLGTSAGTVNRALKAAGVSPRHRASTPSQVADEVAERPDATPAPAPRASVRRQRGGRGFLWSCPDHMPVQAELTRTFTEAVDGLSDHLRHKHPTQEARA